MPRRGEGSEFGLIARYLAPLAGSGSFGLTDDVGELAGLAVTKDLIVCGTHYLPGDPLDLVACKAVRANVSDLVAKGCRPAAMLLGCVWPEGAGEDAFAAFARGLGQDLQTYGLSLLGGDTTSALDLAGPTVSVTMIGVPSGRLVRRSGARPGDRLYLFGTLGDGWLGLRALTGQGAGDVAAANAYRLPDPPLAAAALIARHASASLDVSDGLLADADHLASASGVACAIKAEALPLSASGEAHLRAGGVLADLATGGDDYQPLVAVGPSREGAFCEAAAAAGLAVTAIGRCEAGRGVRLLARDGTDLTPARLGYAHLSG